MVLCRLAATPVTAGREAAAPVAPAGDACCAGGGMTGRRALLLVVASAVAARQGRAQPADPLRQDMLTVARALGFLERPPVGAVTLGIAHADAIPDSGAEAERLARRLDGQLAAGAVLLRPSPVAVELLDAAPPPVLLLPDGMLPMAPGVATRLEGRAVLTVSWLAEPVLAGHVVMAVSSRPRVEILVSREAARRAGIRFASAFRMMIQER